jgi:hypothetical protein
MAIRMIETDESLDEVWDMLTWEEARLLKDENAKDLAPEVSEHLERWAQVNAGQRAAWRAEIIAAAGVSAGDDELDDTIDEIDSHLLHIERDRTALRYKRYFKRPRGEIVRYGLESQLGIVREWVTSLLTEPEDVLKSLGTRLQANVAAGDADIEARRVSATRTADQRIREIVRFIDDVNAARRTRYGVLIQRAEARNLATDWPLRFFKKTTHGPKKAKNA